MAEQIPEAWIGEDVTIFYGPKATRHVGVLKAVTDRGLAVEITVEDEGPLEIWYPYASISNVMRGRPRRLGGATVHSF